MEAEDNVTELGVALIVSNTSPKRILRRMKRTRAADIGAAISSRGSPKNTKPAVPSEKEAVEEGVDAGGLGPARIELMETREALAIAMAALKVTSEEHGRDVERIQHALAVGTCVAISMSKFIREDDGSLGRTEREKVGALREQTTHALQIFTGSNRTSPGRITRRPH